jgi:hypothetical protein
MRKGLSILTFLIFVCGLTLFPRGINAFPNQLYDRLFAVTTIPTISDITDKAINEDTSTGAIDFQVGDAETPVADLVMTGSSSDTTLVPNGNITFGGSNADRTVTVTPAADEFGSATITITVTDGDTESNQDTFLLTVNSINDQPTITDIADETTNEDTPTPDIPFTINDIEDSNASLSLSGTSSNTTLVPNGNISFGGSGSARTVAITPASNQTGQTTITVTVTDSDSSSAFDTFVLTVNSVNDPPTISNITNKSTNEDTATATIPFTIGDNETPDGDLTVSGSSSNTSLVPNSNFAFSGTGSSRNVVITPALNQSGTATITVTVTDGNGGTAQDTFVLTVNAVNDPPTISDITNKNTNEDTTTPAIPFTVNDVDHSPGSLTVTGTSSNQALVPNGNIVFGGSGSSRNVTITPALNQTGSTTITVTVTDGNSSSDFDSFVLDVISVNDPPTISNITDKVTNEDTPTSLIPFTVTDAETPAASLTLSGTSSNTALVPNTNIVFGGAGSTRNVLISPALNQFGSTTITITVTDGNSATTSDTFLLTVNSINDLPTITDVLDQITDEDTPTPAIPFTVSDTETLAASLVLTGSSSNPLVVPDTNITFGGGGAARTVTITPLLNAYGSTTITLTATDLDGGFITDTFLLTVNPILDLPTITDIPNQVTDEDTPTAALPFTVDDAETLAEFLVLQATSSNQILVPDSNITIDGIGSARTITVSPDTNQIGVTTITVTLIDSDGGTAVDTFQLTVLPVNDPPVALGDFYEVVHDKTLKIPGPGILGNDSDVDGDTLLPFLADGQGPSHGTLTLRNSGSFDYKPDPGFIGSDSFQYFVSDDRPTGSLTSNIAQVSINVFDATSPRVSWMVPAKNGEQYDVECEEIELEVEAIDDLIVDYVILSYYDYVQQVDVPIETIFTPPYKTTFNTCVLNPEFNQINAIAYDSAGNNSGYPAFIWLFHYAYTFYLPVLGK